MDDGFDNKMVVATGKLRTLRAHPNILSNRASTLTRRPPDTNLQVLPSLCIGKSYVETGVVTCVDRRLVESPVTALV